MQVERISETQGAIFDALATYRYMTPEHLVQVGVTKSKRHLYATLKELKTRKPAVIVELDFGVLPGHGRLPRIYALTKRGAELVAEMNGGEKRIDVPKSIVAWSNDYFHRLGSIDFHVALRQWAQHAGADINFYTSYYDPRRPDAGTFAPATRIRMKRGFLDPDAVFSFTAPDGVERLYVFEMCRGRKTKHVEDKLLTYIQAFDQEAIEKTYDYPAEARVLCIFEDARALELVAERMEKYPFFRDFRSVFFTKTLKAMKGEFRSGWGHFDNEVSDLY